jgi:tetratricopeptide (TPR) repeat protein
LCGLLCAGLLVLSALAAPARADATGEARRAYADAEVEYHLGHFAESLQNYELAYKLSRVPALLFNIAQCHRQLKHFEQAATTYRSFIGLQPKHPAVVKARALLAEVEQAVLSERRAAEAPPLDPAQRQEGPPELAPSVQLQPQQQALPAVAVALPLTPSAFVVPVSGAMTLLTPGLVTKTCLPASGLPYASRAVKSTLAVEVPSA